VVPEHVALGYAATNGTQEGLPSVVFFIGLTNFLLKNLEVQLFLVTFAG
jgi:hypothetical protein